MNPTYGYAYIGLCQGRAVIDSIPHHGHFVALGLKSPNLRHLVTWQHLIIVS